MGIIRAAVNSVTGSLADQWLEVIQPDNMGDSTVMTSGIQVRRGGKNQNKKGMSGLISEGSVIHVGEKQFMLLVDGGKVVDYSAEAGYFEVRNGGVPSLFNGQFEQTVLDTFQRVKFGGIPTQSQQVFYINTQEMKNIAFGTVNPINYFDDFYNAELYLRAHGYFSIRIVDPLKFYSEAVPKNASRVEITDIHRLYLAEFLTALQTAIGQMSVDGIRISHVASKTSELAKYLSTILDEDWTKRRGMIIESVGISSISYDEESKKLINIRNQGAMLSDATIREGYLQGSVARGIESAGSNKSGGMRGFMGVNMGRQNAEGFSAANQAQMERDAKAKADAQQAQAAAGTWSCSCGTANRGKFCSNCGNPQPTVSQWTCSCGTKNTGNFCGNCGNKRPGGCPKCGKPVEDGARFCSSCGEKL